MSQTTTEDPVMRVQRLRSTVQRLSSERARAEAARDAAEGQLRSLLSEHGVTTVAELEQMATRARQTAQELLDAAEAAVGL